MTNLGRVDVESILEEEMHRSENKVAASPSMLSPLDCTHATSCGSPQLHLGKRDALKLRMASR